MEKESMQQIARFMLKKNLTILETAQTFHISVSTVSKVLSNLSNPGAYYDITLAPLIKERMKKIPVKTMNIDKELIQQVARYIIDNHTIVEAATQFKLGRNTVNKYLKLLRTKGSPYYDHVLAPLLSTALIRNSLEGRIQGGKVGHKELMISEKEALNIKKIMIENNYSYREMAEVLGVHYSTLYKAIERIEANTELESLKRGR